MRGSGTICGVGSLGTALRLQRSDECSIHSRRTIPRGPYRQGSDAVNVEVLRSNRRRGASLPDSCGSRAVSKTDP
jgi:hypothetical protein